MTTKNKIFTRNNAVVTKNNKVSTGCAPCFVQAAPCSGESGGEDPPWITCADFVTLSGKVVQLLEDGPCFYFDPDATPTDTASGTVYSPSDFFIFPTCLSCTDTRSNICNTSSAKYSLSVSGTDSNYTESNFTTSIDDSMAPFPVILVGGPGCHFSWVPDFDEEFDESIPGRYVPSPDVYAYLPVDQTNPFDSEETGYRLYDQASLDWIPRGTTGYETDGGAWFAWIAKSPHGTPLHGQPFYIWRGGHNADDPSDGDWSFDATRSNIDGSDPSIPVTSPGELDVGAAP